MSLHCYRFQHASTKRDVYLQIGWDPILGRYYMDLWYLDEKGRDTEEFLFNDFDHSDVFGGKNLTLENYRDWLVKNDIPFPVKMIDAVRDDAIHNRGNHIRNWNVALSSVVATDIN